MRRAAAFARDPPGLPVPCRHRAPTPPTSRSCIPSRPHAARDAARRHVPRTHQSHVVSATPTAARCLPSLDAPPPPLPPPPPHLRQPPRAFSSEPTAAAPDHPSRRVSAQHPSCPCHTSAAGPLQDYPACPPPAPASCQGPPRLPHAHPEEPPGGDAPRAAALRHHSGHIWPGDPRRRPPNRADRVRLVAAHGRAGVRGGAARDGDRTRGRGGVEQHTPHRVQGFCRCGRCGLRRLGFGRRARGAGGPR
jgi:hypothetical protein